MDFTILKYGAYLILGLVIIGAVALLVRRPKLSIPAFLDDDPDHPLSANTSGELPDDGFYCIMTRDGCKSGWR